MLFILIFAQWRIKQAAITSGHCYIPKLAKPEQSEFFAHEATIP
ncbi:MAG: hypothetical protein ACI9FR_002145 [Cryomorphaceae bacterium]|jgi:hypothetical protein